MEAVEHNSGNEHRILLCRAALVAHLAFAVLAGFPVAMAGPTHAGTAVDFNRRTGRETGLPLPRFASVKAKRAKMRVGPSVRYMVKWIYRRPGAPLEIIEEYGHWRQVRDFDGETGWMHSALLTSRRTGVVAPWSKENIPLRDAPSVSASEIALLQPSVALRVNSCDRTWCNVATKQQNLQGYLPQGAVWGVYPGETVRK